MDNKKQQTFQKDSKRNSYKIIIIILAVISIVFIFSMFNKEEWTLMVCETRLNENECFDNSYEISGFDTSTECILKGVSEFKEEGFECGRNCKKEGELNICDVICNSGGCQD